MLRSVALVFFALLPSVVKTTWLRQRGHDIGRDVYLGISYYDIEAMSLADGARIGHGNVFKGMRRLELGRNSTIGRFNLFTSNRYFRSLYREAGELVVGDYAAITMRHYFDIQHRISIGSRSLIAGIQTMFFTHQKGLSQLNEAKPISVGECVYVGAGSRLLPGATVCSHVIIGAGSGVGGALDQEYSLYASPKAMRVKELPASTPFFTDPDATGPNRMAD